MTAAWTGLAKGDLGSALVAMAANPLLALLILPAYLSMLVPGNVGFDPTALYRQLAVVIVTPMIAGTLTRRLLLRRYGPESFKRMKPTFGGVSSFGVMLIVFIAMTMRSTATLADPIGSASTVVPLVVFYAIILAVGAGLGGALLDAERSTALVYATSMRNLSIAVALVVAPGFPPTEAVLPIALAHLVQPPLGAVYMDYRRDVVGAGRAVREVIRAVI